MAGTFLLVHGAWHGGWCWDRVAARLRAKGHRVIAPTLSGLNEQALGPQRDITLSTHVADVVGVIDGLHLEQVVICGHSYGGMVISGVVEQRSEVIAAMVYLDAFLPTDGDSVASLAPIGRSLPDMVASGASHVPALSAEHFAVNRNDRAWVDAQCLPQPLGTFSEAITLTGAREAIATKVYVRATGYAAPWFDAALAAVQDHMGWSSQVMTCGHDAMIDCPDEVAALLERVATG